MSSQINIVFEDDLKIKTEHISYELYDAEIVDKFCLLLDQTKPTSDLSTRVDIRRAQGAETTLGYANEMNDVIFQINELDEYCQIADNLLLDLAVEPHLQVEKLNRLHEIFQLYSEKWGTGVNETQVLLERVNLLVHFMEAAPVEINQVFVVAKQYGYAQWMLPDLNLTPEDHMLRMPHSQWGCLEMDYNTIGKDVGACFWTDDAGLIKRGEHRQQMVMTPGVAANFQHDPNNYPTGKSDQAKIDEYYAWCESQGLGDYIDYKAPEYRLGRLRLGHINKAYTMDDILELTTLYPTVKEIEVTQ